MPESFLIPVDVLQIFVTYLVIDEQLKPNQTLNDRLRDSPKSPAYRVENLRLNPWRPAGTIFRYGLPDLALFRQPATITNRIVQKKLTLPRRLMIRLTNFEISQDINQTKKPNETSNES